MTRIQWNLGDFASGEILSISISVKQTIEPKDYVVGLDVADPDEFIARNPKWVFSKALNAPFRYFPMMKTTPALWALPSLELSHTDGKGKLFVEEWRKTASPCVTVFEAALFTVRARRGSFRTYIVSGEAAA